MDRITQNTEIHVQDVQDVDHETILTIRRMDDIHIHININHYYKDNVIEVGNIVVSQTEWDLINTNLNKEVEEKLFICPQCGDIVTEKKIIASRQEGGYGCCMCKFGNGQRILVPYEVYDPPIMDDPITPKEIEVIRAMREINEE